MRARWLLPLLVLLLVAGCGPDHTTARLRLLTVQGTGRVSARPDLLTVQLGVETRAPTATAALEDDNRRAQSVIDLLKQHGVAADDIQTASLNIGPSFDGKGRPNGYTVSNIVTAKLRKLDAAGAVIDAAATAAGDAVRLQGVSFSVEDNGATLKRARQAAVDDARSRADVLAGTGRVGVARVRSIREVSAAPPVPLTADRAASAGGAGAASVPLEAGTQELDVQVEVVYELR